MKPQAVPEDRVFTLRATGEIYVWRGKTITPATPEELAFIEAIHPKTPVSAFDHDGDGKPGGSKPVKGKRS